MTARKEHFDVVDSASRHIELSGEEETVDGIVSTKRSIERAQGKLERERIILQDAAAKLRKHQESRGLFTKVVLCLGSRTNVSLTYKDVYSDMPQAAEEKLRGMLGNAYPKLFRSATRLKLRPEAMDQLMELLGSRLTEFFEVTEVIEPMDYLRFVAFGMREKLDPQQREALDHIVGQIAAKPTLNVK